MKSLRQIIKEELNDWDWAENYLTKKSGLITKDNINYLQPGDKLLFTQLYSALPDNLPCTLVKVTDEYLIIHFDNDDAQYRGHGAPVDGTPTEGCEDGKCWFIMLNDLITNKPQTFLKYQ